VSLACRWEDIVTPPIEQKENCLYNSQYKIGEIHFALENSSPNLSHYEKVVLSRLSRIQDQKTGQLNITNQSLANTAFGISERTVGRVLKSLEDKKLIERKYFTQVFNGKAKNRRQINVNWNSLVISTPGQGGKEDKEYNTEHSTNSNYLKTSSLRCASRSQEFNSSSRGNNVIPFKKENRMDNQPLVSSDPDNVVPFPFDPDPLKATPIKERFVKIEKMIDEAMMGACESMDPRALRIYRLTSTMEEVKQFLIWEEIDLPTLRQRMQANLSYDPIKNPDQIWCEDCHVNYAHLEESQRNVMFYNAYEKYMAPFLITNQTKKNVLTMLHNARKRADSVKALYHEYVAAQYDHIGASNVDHRKMLGRFGIEIYEKWRANGSVLPANYGWLSLQGKKGVPFKRKRAYTPHISNKQKREALIEKSAQEVERDPTYLRVVK
jgi:hypothetical protein